MTKDEARAEAHRRWGDNNLSDGGRYGAVCLHRTTHPARYEVGYMTRAFRAADQCPMVVMGSSTVSWDAAFANTMAFRHLI